jgi:putative nucleotidyltransferase with HDIG domain
MALLDAHSSIVTSLLVVMAKKNAPIFHHCARVAGYALQIAYSLELTPPEFENLVVAALLHDVGKVGINDELLHKSGSLTDPEWEMMKQHSRSGADILGPYASFRALLPAILHHHERFDGLGYPDQLVGAAIPLHARIISVADTYDAIITDRPYRSAWSHAFACEEIARVAGSQLDPVIVSHFLRIAQALQRSGLKYTNRTDVSADLSTNNHQL